MKRFTFIEMIVLMMLIVLLFVASYPIVAVITAWFINGTENTPVEIRMKMFDLVQVLWGAIVGSLSTTLAFMFREKMKEQSTSSTS